MPNFEVLYPGIFTEKGKPFGEKYIADNLAIAERGAIDLEALVTGALPADTPALLDLARWIETITGEIWLEGAVNVKLPSKRTG
jgi:hypothetical protein